MTGRCSLKGSGCSLGVELLLIFSATSEGEGRVRRVTEVTVTSSSVRGSDVWLPLPWLAEAIAGGGTCNIPLSAFSQFLEDFPHR